MLASSKWLGRWHTCTLLLLKLKKQEGCNNHFHTPPPTWTSSSKLSACTLRVISCSEVHLGPQLKPRVWEETRSEPPCIQFTPELASSALLLRHVCARFSFASKIYSLTQTFAMTLSLKPHSNTNPLLKSHTSVHTFPSQLTLYLEIASINFTKKKCRFPPRYEQEPLTYHVAAF